MRWVPFTVHVRVVPARGKRFEYVRDLQKISQLVFDEITTISDVQFAEPGGGQHRSFGGTDRGGMSGLVRGCAVKPQMGQTPAQLQITGYNGKDTANFQPHPDKELIHTGQVLNGPGAHSWDSNPVSAIDDEVKALKTALESAIDTALPADIEFQIFRMEYSGITYGDRGYTFPQ